MPEQTIKLDLTKIPFGRARSKVMVYEENNADGESFKTGLFFAMMNQGAEARRKGLVDIVPTWNGEELEYTYEASPEKLRLNTEKGEIRVIIDTDDTMRIASSGVGVRLYTKIPFMSMESATMLPGGLADMNLMSYRSDGGRFMFKALRGKITLDSVFNPVINGPEDAKVELLPDDNGELDVITYFMNPDEWGYIEPKPLDLCTKEIIAEFKEFETVYPKMDDKYEELRNICVYAVWLHKMSPSKVEIIPTLKAELMYSNVLTRAWASTFEQAIHTLAMKDATSALEIIEGVYAHSVNGMLPKTVSTARSHYQATPPVQCLAVKEILKKKELPREQIEKLYSAMSENYLWWQKSHSFGENRFSYNHSGELAIDGSAYSTFEFPLETPDLYAMMTVYAQVLAMLSAIVGDGKEAQWKAKEQAIFNNLMSLWDGEIFNCKAAVSGKMFKTKSLLAYLPVILSDRLPAEVIARLAGDLEDENKFLSDIGLRSESKQSEYFNASVEGRGAVVMWMQELIIYGVERISQQLAKKIAERVINGVTAHGVRDVLASNGEQPTARPGDYINAVAASVVLYLTGILGK